MFGKKNLSHQQALEHLQTLFPSVALPVVAKDMKLSDFLMVDLTLKQNIANTLPRPDCNDCQSSVVMNIKSVADSQEYKIQKNMIQIQEEGSEDFLSLEAECKSDFDMFYEQRSTAIDLDRKNSSETGCGFLGSSSSSEEAENLWWNNEHNGKENIQPDLQKECFSFLN